MVSTRAAHRRVAADRQPLHLWVLLGSLALNMFAGSWSLLGVPVPLDRGLLAVGLLLLVLDPVAWASVRLRPRWVHVAMVLLVGDAGVSALLHGTLTTSYGFFALTDRLVIPFLLLTLGPVVFRTPAQRTLLLQVLTVVGLYLGAIALLGSVGLTALVVPHYINDPTLGIGADRARGPFLASEALGIVLCQCGFAAAVLAAQSRGAWRAVAVLVVPLAALGVLLTLTRSVWLGTALGVVVALALEPRLRRWLPVAAAVGAVGVLVALAVVPGLSAAAGERTTNERSVDDRLNTNAAALRIVEQDPLFGIGWVRFTTDNGEYVRQAADYPITNTAIEVHDVALGRAAELGLPGALLWLLCVLGGPALAVARRLPGLHAWRLLCAGSGLCWFTATLLSPVPYPMANNLVFLLAGIGLGPWLTAPRGDAVSAVPSPAAPPG